MRKILYKFTHGLGDAVQFTCVLRHLKKYRPDWEVSVAALVGKHSAFYGLCQHVYVLDRDPINEDAFEEVITPGWHENHSANPSSPHTKICNFLREECQIDPDPNLLKYSISLSPEAIQRAAGYMNKIAAPDDNGVFPVVAIHYEGNTSTGNKNLSHEVVAAVCQAIIGHGYTPLILDWDKRSPLPDQRYIFCHGAHDADLCNNNGTGDAEHIAALIDQCTLMVGIDSGPLHVAGAVDTPTVGVWTGHHPLKYYDLCPNVIHLIPEEWRKLSPCNDPEAAYYFVTHYRYDTYSTLDQALSNVIKFGLPKRSFRTLANEEEKNLSGLSATAFDKRYYDEHTHAGLDYLCHGLWQEEYGRWLVGSLGLQGKNVLDAGCACGSILMGILKAGATGHGVDLNEYMIGLGRRERFELSDKLHTCDVVNLHLFKDATFDAIHSAQSAEHWRPDLVPGILRELGRVTRPGGLFFCALDTEELYARQHRRIDTEDPTHICIRSMAWWHGQLIESGWEVCSNEYESAMREHPESFLRRYDWDWFVARKL